MTDGEKQAYLERIAAELGEHFDCVQILAHDSETESYTTFEAGAGSLFARQYQALRFAEELENQNQHDDEP